MPKKFVITPLCANPLCRHPRRQHRRGSGSCNHIGCRCMKYAKPEEEK
jgi:hypothetical protein